MLDMHVLHGEYGSALYVEMARKNGCLYFSIASDS